MIIDKIRASTAQIHRELDLWLMPLFKQIDNKKKYTGMLEAFYGYYKPVMDLIAVEMDTQYLPDFAQRRQPSLILKDLENVNKKKPGTIEEANLLPKITNAAEAFGALYVLEGSTLGGFFLSKMLAENMKMDEDSGLSFFYGYGKNSSAKWRVFVDQLNMFAAEKGNEEEIISTATHTFSFLKKHLQDTLYYN